jgi:hypothetical protein
MSCSDNTIHNRRGNGFVIIIVLYVLLAIILGGVSNY